MESIGDGVSKLLEPIAKMFNKDGKVENPLAYAVGFTVVILVVLFFVFRKKLTPTKIRYRARALRSRMMSYRSKYKK